MSIIVVGLSHKTAPVEIRERLAFSNNQIHTALRELVDGRELSEGLIISTCNRVEVVSNAEVAPQQAFNRVSRFLYDYHRLPQASIDNYLYCHSEQSAVKHVFRVASSLDSMVVGEPQILGQVKDAYDMAVEAGTVGRILNQVMQRAFTVAKRIRAETNIASSAVSVSYVAVELANKIFEDLRGKTVFLLGAGEMSELAAKHLLNSGASRMMIATRTFEKAQQLAAEFNAEAVDFVERQQRLSDADIVICSTGAERYVLNPEDIRRALDIRRNRPILIVDISVPRNIDPAIGRLDNVYLFDIDDLQAVVQANLKEREREAAVAESIIDSEVTKLFSRLQAIDIGPTIAALKQHLNDLAVAEFERNRKKLGPLTPEQEQAIRAMLSSITNKVAHPMITHLRESTENGSYSVDVWRKMYHLDEKK